MATQAITDVISASPSWMRAWADLAAGDPELEASLTRLGLGRPLTWAGIAEGSGEAMTKLELMLTSLGLLPPGDADLRASRLALCQPVLGAAVGLGRDWVARTVEVSGFDISIDHEQACKRAKLSEHEALLTKLGAPELQGLPTNWRGKTYRRLEQAGGSAGRQRAEEKERAGQEGEERRPRAKRRGAE